LLVLSLVYFVLLARTSFTERVQWLLGFGLLIGILLQSGGFFLHMLTGEAGGGGSVGTLTTRVGAILLAAALLALAVGLLRTRTTPATTTPAG
jgi:heme/copper-type cytochrome/quinol oxidase subunit 4